MNKTGFITKILVLISCLAVLCALIPAPVQAKSQEVTIRGPIVSRSGDTMKVHADTGMVEVTLAKTTKVKVVKGLIGIRTQEMSMAALIPGLRVEVKAFNRNNEYIAKSVSFKADDLKTANEIQAALAVTQQQVQTHQEKIEANKQDIESSKQDIEANKEAIEQGKAEDAALAKRFGELKEYDLKEIVTVLFDVNSAKLSDKAKADLKSLADKAKGLKGYLIEVAGYADSSGKADYNQDLSDRRAAAVTAYLRKSCEVPISRVLAPAAMGMSKPVASNETPAGKAENRRVEVKVIVNRGLSQ
ncbi:MAG TPA: OmpA family protein [Geobacteraceae bacterium]|nr:OmpA family protein [Geobacteraceae bacterium]